MDDIRGGIYFFATLLVFEFSRTKFAGQGISLGAAGGLSGGKQTAAQKHGEAWRFLETVVMFYVVFFNCPKNHWTLL